MQYDSSQFDQDIGPLVLKQPRPVGQMDGWMECEIVDTSNE